MNDDRFGGELHAWIEPEIEARLVALILGEASDFEAEEMERMMKERPELRIFKRRLEVVHSLMGEAVRPPDAENWRMAPERRAEVMKSLGIKAPEEPEVVLIDAGRERRVRRAGLRVAMMAAACLLISLVLAPFLLRGTKDGWAGANQEMAEPKSVTYSMATDNYDVDEERAVHWDRSNEPGYAGGVLNGPAGSREDGEHAGGNAVGDRLAALKDNLGTQERYFTGAEPSEDGAALEGVTLDDVATRIRRTPAVPSSSMAKVIASTTPSPTAIPVPEVVVPEPSTDFGAGDDFGDGWGLGGGGTFGNGRVSGREKGLVENQTKSEPTKLSSAMARTTSKSKPVSPPSKKPAAPATRPAPVAKPQSGEAIVNHLALVDREANQPVPTDEPAVPEVGDLPVVGRLFGTAGNEKKREESVSGLGVAGKALAADQTGERNERDWYSKTESEKRGSRSARESEEREAVRKIAPMQKAEQLAERSDDESEGEADPFAAPEVFYDKAEAAKKARILTKHVEVKQANTDELSFDWIQDASKKADVSSLKSDLKPGGSSWAYGERDERRKVAADELFIAGGAVVDGREQAGVKYVDPVKFKTIPGIPQGVDQEVNGVVTGGLRSGDAAVTRNSIDGVDVSNPGAGGPNSSLNVQPDVTGLFNDGQQKMINRGLKEAKQKFAVPAKPTAFETRNTGVILEVEPSAGPRGQIVERLVDTETKPDVVEFDGFLNYDQPVTGPSRPAITSGQRVDVPAVGSSSGVMVDAVDGGLRRDLSLDGKKGQDSVESLGRFAKELQDVDGDGLEMEEEFAKRGEARKDTASLAWVDEAKGLERGRGGEADHKSAETALEGFEDGMSIRKRELLRRGNPATNDETRAKLLSEVDKSWEMAVPSEDEGISAEAHLGSKLDSIVIPSLDLEGSTVEEAMDFLRQRTRELDTELDPARKGVNMVLRKARIEGGSAADAELDAEAGLGGVDPGTAVIKGLKMENVTLRQALEAIGDQAGMRLKQDEYAVTMLPQGSAEGDEYLTRRWSVPKNFVKDLNGMALEDSDDVDPFAPDAGGGLGGGLEARKPLIDVLKDAGISFPPGTSATFLAGSGTLVVKGTPENLDLMDALVESVGEGSPPVDYMGLYEPPGDEGIPEDILKEHEEEVALMNKLKTTIIPSVDFDGATVEEAIDFLRQRSVQLDTVSQVDRGVDFTIRKARVQGGDYGLDAELDAEAGLGGGDPGQAMIKELKLRNVPLATVLQYVCDQAGLRYKVQKGKVTLLPLSGAEGDEPLVRSWKLHPDVLERLQEDMMDHAFDEDDPFADSESRMKDSLAQMTASKKDLIEIMKDCGISFPPSTSVTYLKDSQTLVVKNTPSNLDLVDALMEDTARRLAGERQAMKTDEKSASQEAFSTFSLHVSDVSFKLAQAALAKGEWPEAERIRVEEFVNAFDYGDPAPSQNQKVSCALEQAAHPFMQQRNMLRIAMRTAAVGRASGTPLRLTVLLDNSGSMERSDRAESVKRAFQLLAAQMNPQDEVTLISFARKPRLMRDSVPGNKVGDLVQLIADTPSEGGTNLEEALRLGVEKAQEDYLEGAQNRIILLTDGAANLGNAEPELLGAMVEKMRQKGIAFDACGVGAEGLNDDVLEALTRKGDGRYYFLDRPEDADAGFAKQIAGALRPAAKNVKVQVEFNPKRVGHYRLYGFEKHELKKEDFRDDKVDAAEMAAEEAGVAMYQVETLPDGEGDVGSVSVRFMDMASGEMVEKRWAIPYEANPADLESAAPSMKLAASAAFLGEKLKGTPVGDLVELGELSGVSRSLQPIYTSDARVGQLIEMIEKARGMAR